MKRLLKKIDDVMVAITFAEAGELDEAKEIIKDAAPAQTFAKEREYDPTYEAA